MTYAGRPRGQSSTTGSKILLEFLIDGQPMGREVTVRDKPKLSIEAHGTAEIETVEVLRYSNSAGEKRTRPRSGRTTEKGKGNRRHGRSAIGERKRTGQARTGAAGERRTDAESRVGRIGVSGRPPERRNLGVASHTVTEITLPRKLRARALKGSARTASWRRSA